jgi:hypothetical protein
VQGEPHTQLQQIGRKKQSHKHTLKQTATKAAKTARHLHANSTTGFDRFGRRCGCCCVGSFAFSKLEQRHWGTELDFLTQKTWGFQSRVPGGKKNTLPQEYFARAAK